MAGANASVEVQYNKQIAYCENTDDGGNKLLQTFIGTWYCVRACVFGVRVWGVCGCGWVWLGVCGGEGACGCVWMCVFCVWACVFWCTCVGSVCGWVWVCGVRVCVGVRICVCVCVSVFVSVHVWVFVFWFTCVGCRVCGCGCVLVHVGV
jgi:hypothetical protein